MTDRNLHESPRDALDAASEREADALLALFEQRRYAEAETQVRQWIERHPSDAFGWKLLGAILQQSRRNQEAAAALEQALRLDSQDSESLNTLGAALQDLGRLAEAGVRYAQAAKLSPGFVAAIYNLAGLLQTMGRLEESQAYYARVLAIDPQHVKALNNHGSVLRELGRLDEALACFRQAVAIQPNQADAYSNLGNALIAQGRLDEALACHERAAMLQPGHPKILSNLGNALQHLGRLDESLATYQRAMAIHAEHNPIDQKALASQQLASLIQSEHPEMLVILGNTNQYLGNLDEAESAYRRALAISVDYSIYSKLLFTLNYYPDKSASEIFAVYQDFDQRFGEPHRASWQPHANDPDPMRRLRIGYVSPDFRSHSSRHFLEPLLAQHDKSQVELTAYAELTRDDAVTARYRKYVDHWVPTKGVSDADLAARIRADGIDILIDVAGHTANNRLGIFARRPAPVSVSWMGYGYTTGLSAIDYFLCDPVMVPDGSEGLFAEQPWRLDVPSLVYRPAEGMGEVGPLPALDRGHLTFGTLTRSVRINHRTIRVWSAILQQVPGSRLVVDSKDFSTEAMQQMLAERFAAHGIGPERLEIGCHSPPWDVLRGIDIGLDCFPHNSGTTLIESLYLGVPFITLAERPSVGRIGSLMLAGAGRAEWIADSEEDYIAKAVALAGDLERLAMIRASLRDELERGPWRDEAGFARRVEQAYREMWQRWCLKHSTAINENQLAC
ncbi:tetratricopeptide repeat protein [Allochromatium palmeri]|uniref:protein O-GlcNAc transferase n=1 Tax=Allochromatium palmeri TaxID=231048 RepID=A0A6N8EBA5_9GAMM|nr:tetratricopeptide repeat protein [Allochromatium palmeri]MTW20638.1 tetratricopeptide repeat protein [Allochromatium palmeri]